MKAKKWTHGTIGSISHATMRTQDLIPAFCEELRYLGHRDTLLTSIEYESKSPRFYESESANIALESLFNMLDSHALPYMYFGAHPGNGSDYGFWLSEVFINDEFDGLTVSDTSEVPDNYTGEVLHVNERGNMTLYTAKRGKLTEVFSVV